VDIVRLASLEVDQRFILPFEVGSQSAIAPQLRRRREAGRLNWPRTSRHCEFSASVYGHLSVKIRPIGAGYWTHCAAMALAARGVDGVIE